MNVWFDFDNPPQVRYLLPLARRFGAAGHDLLLTARDYGDTREILREEGIDATVVGASFGTGARRKIVGLGRRTAQLVAAARREPKRPDLVVTGSRAATLAARALRVPSFVILDYEYVDLVVYALSASTVLHPNVIEERSFRRRGSRRIRLVPFDGLKEDISFADVDLGAVAPYDLGPAAAEVPRVLVRPPAEDSHYFRDDSRLLARRLLRHLAAADVQVVLSPRRPEQAAYVDEIEGWRHRPIVLRRPAPFVPLLEAVDAVVSAGGTMLREAAFLGIPAYSIFQSEIGAVDAHLADTGRLTILGSESDFGRIALRRRPELAPLRPDRDVADEVMSLIAERAERRSGS